MMQTRAVAQAANQRYHKPLSLHAPIQMPTTRQSTHLMLSVGPLPLLLTDTPSSPTACREWLPFRMTSWGEMGCPSLCRTQVEGSTALGSGRHLRNHKWASWARGKTNGGWSRMEHVQCDLNSMMNTQACKE